MNPRHRLLFVDGHSGPLGGAQINLLELLAHADAGRRWEVRVACCPSSPLAAALKRQRVLRHDYVLEAAGRGIRTLFRLGTARDREAAASRLRDVLAGFSPEAVISCSGPDHLVSGMAAAGHRIPSIWWVNEIVSPDFFSWPARRTFVSEALAHATRLVPVSEYGKRALVQAGLPPSRIRVVHNGIPLRDYRRSDSRLLRERLKLKPGEPLIGLLGRITPWKGTRFFVELAERWAAQGRPGRFVIVGPTAPEEAAFAASLRTLVRSKGLSGRVAFPPPAANDADTLSQLDVLLHCSVKPEPFGRVIIEGMAVGVPVISAKDGGVPEIVTPGVNGGLARPGDHEDYLAQLTAVLGSPSMRAAWVLAGRRTVQQRFTLDRVFDGFQRILAECIAEPGERSEGKAAAPQEDQETWSRNPVSSRIFLLPASSSTG
ncbi:MAG: glycosyltransferase family 4 protein [Verrucomicrobiae bacterium]|nr:glycosyltransferase family 4 protein [Verrucomicrobiae bacterium]